MGRTETVRDNLNPNFTKSFLVDYMFEMKQDCRFEVHDDDGASSENLGSSETTIGKLMVTTTNHLSRELKSRLQS
jgi:hypothetical protein